jgi:hypothetical protein
MRDEVGRPVLSFILHPSHLPIDTFAVLAELQGTRNRPDAMDFAAVFAEHVIPGYRALMESYDKAQSVGKVGRETKQDRLEAASARK